MKISRSSLRSWAARFTAMSASLPADRTFPKVTEGSHGAHLTFGMSTALSEPAANLGIAMRDGVLAAFARQNRAGGIAGHNLELKVLDDGYEPTRTVPNIRQLIEQQVLAIVGNVGNPTAIATISLATQAKTAFFGAYTGAGILRKTRTDRYVINYRASYAQETAAMVDGLIRYAGLQPDEIVLFTQRDGYGDAGFHGGVQALIRHRLTNKSAFAHGRYERDTSVVEGGLADTISAAKMPKAIILVGTYEPCARFIQVVKDVGLTPRVLNVSFVGATSLAKQLGQDGDSVIVTQIVPHMHGALAIVSAYAADMKCLNEDWKPDFGSLEGYIVGRILCRALVAGRAESPSTEWVVRSLENLGTLDMSVGVPLHLSKDMHQAPSNVWPTTMGEGNVKPIEWKTLAPNQ
jgi:branched-chain amino acid transport system substrate-binding protein